MICRRSTLFATLLAAICLTTATPIAQDPLPVPVFVTHLETPQLPPLRPEQHEAESNRTRAEMFERAAQLRKRHGDKTSAWPPAVWKEFYVAEDAHRLAVARRDYEPANTRLLLADSVKDLRDARANKFITMVTSMEEASLVVQVTGRRRTSPPGPTDNRYFIRFRLAPGERMSAEQFDELTTGVKWDSLWAKVIAHPTADSPCVDLEAGAMASWKQGADMVRGIVLGFVRDRMDPERKK